MKPQRTQKNTLRTLKGYIDKISIKRIVIYNFEKHMD
jgi:hypothetical protein